MGPQRSRGQHILGGAAADCLVWGVPAAVFLSLYIGVFGRSVEAIGPHLACVLLIAAAVATLRLVMLRGLGQRAGLMAGAVVMGPVFFLLLAYYVTVIIGLANWRRVATLPLLKGYVSHLDQLAEALQINAMAVAMLLAGMLALVCMFFWWGLRKFEWLGSLRELVPSRMRLPVFAAVVLCWWAGAYTWSTGVWGAADEPLSLSFVREAESRPNFQSHSVVADSEAQVREERARNDYQPANDARRRNVILIVVDALRADHMGVYGYARPTTPHLQAPERLATLRKAEVARAVCSESFCGLMGLASARYVHQFVDNPITLQEVLQRHGYRIHLVLAGDHVNFYGLGKTYGKVDSYVDGSMLPGYANDDRLLVNHIRGMPDWDGKPAMIQFHLMSTHCLGSRYAEYRRFLPAHNRCLPTASTDPDLVQASVNYYDNGVLQLDGLLQQLMTALSNKRYLDNALVVVVGDHGEYIGEHGRFRHAHGVHEPVVRIPFLLLPFGYQPGEPFARKTASQVDVAPTILRELGMPLPATWTGVPMQVPMPSRITYFQQGLDFGLVDERGPGSTWKYWFNKETGKEFAYNLEADPREADNQIAAVPRELRFRWFREVGANLTLSGPTQAFPDTTVTGK